MSNAHAIPTLPLRSRRRVPWIAEIGRGTLGLMTVTEAVEREELVDDEQQLALAAAGGDGDAFATLYERYERRAYNLALRITGSAEDAADAVQDAFLGVLKRLSGRGGDDLAFGSYLFTATRNACYDLMEKRRRVEPTASISESAAPLGSGAGGLGLDPGDPEEDPSRRQLLDSQRGEVREANDRLPERQREVLALRELEELPYDEIAAIMGMNRNSVAQLISRARLNLRAELRGAALDSIAASAPECERATPLIAQREDGELGDDEKAGWLAAHLATCGGCRLRVDAMHEAGVSYRAWAPVAAAPWLFKETMARAAELTGADWSETIASRGSPRPDLAALPGIPAAFLVKCPEPASTRRRVATTTVVLALLLVALVTAREIDNGDPAGEPPVVRERGGGAASIVEQPGDPKGDERAPTHSPAVASRPSEAPVTESFSSDDSALADPAPTAASRDEQAPEKRGSEPSPSGRQPGAGAVTPAADLGGSAAEEPEAVPPPPAQPEPEPPVREPEPPPRDPRPPTAPGGGFKVAPPPGPIPQ